ncbi:MAG: hypothetical protein COB03_00310 [Alteromonas sp.]|jgi:hypothetical protein|nr:hypothetical protein [Rickettsiales bacterium]PHS60234.1 MAG: hypothetical protein COB03_00310 [Alteromonas sp.]
MPFILSFGYPNAVIRYFSFGTLFTSISLAGEAHPVKKMLSRAKVASRNIVYLVNIKSIPHVELGCVL